MTVIDEEATRAEQMRSSAHLGATYRGILVAPAAGFASALRIARRREREGVARAEGVAPYLFSAAGGASGVLLWLKVSALAGLRAESAITFRWSFLIAAVLIGAALSLLTQGLWGAVAPLVATRLGGSLGGRSARLVWGAAAFPQLFPLLLLLPLDLLLVGSAAFTSAPIASTIGSGWAAFSTALSVAFAGWSMFLFVRGLQVVTSMKIGRVLLLAAVGLVSFAAILLAFRTGAVLLAGAS